MESAETDHVVFLRLLRITSARALFASVLAGACVAASLPATAATSGTVVGATVLSATALDAGGCRSGIAGKTLLGPLASNAGTIGTTDCSVSFGSSNDTARLELHQGDGTGTALAKLATTNTRLQDDVRLYGVGAQSATNAWAVGQSGTILHWDGSTWTSQASGTAVTLRTVVAVDPLTAWVVGANATVRKTINGGTSWPQQNTGVGTLQGVAATDDQHAWAVGLNGQALLTTDGTAWNPSVSGTTQDLNDIVVVTPSIIVAVGANGTIIRSTDGGLNYAPVASGTTVSLSSVTKRDATHLFAAGSSSTVLRSDDAGATWTAMTGLPNFSYMGIVADATTGILAMSEHGVGARSTNDGASWTTEQSTWQNSVNGMDQIGATTFATGDGHLLMTSGNLGQTWSASPLFRASLNGVYATSRNQAWTVGARGEIRATTDGSTMVTQASGTIEEFRDIDGSGNSSIWAVGMNGVLRATTNGGATWVPQTGGITQHLRAVDAVTEQVVWIAGGTSQAMRTLNGGSTWQTLTLPGAGVVYSVSAANKDVAWVGGAGGYLARTTDGGATWATITLPAAYAAHTTLVSGAEPTGLRLVAASSGGSVYRTTDGGATWTPVAGINGAYSTINSIDAHDTNAMALAVASGNVTYSLDGSTWVVAAGGSPSRSNFDVSFPDAQSVWTSADSWALLRTTTSASTFPDFQDDPGNSTGNDWGTPGAAFFGACLRSLTSASAVDWLIDPNTDCTATDADPWHAIVPLVGTSGSTIARTTVAGATGTADLRFAMRSGTTAAGTYGGSIRVEVVAPG
ncbi:MAG: hypothetical protein JWL76_999 [Thermoleophilia bacterium]|nr:hypothetical protein [Thermoleophilia bacterium]